MDFTVYTYGSGRFIASILEAVKMFVVEGTDARGILLSLIKIMLLSGTFYFLSMSLLRFLGSRGIADTHEPVSPIIVMIRNGVLAVLIMTVFMNSALTVDVPVEDKQDPSQSRVVTEVPWGLAFVMHTTSVIGQKLGEVIEDVLSPPEAIRVTSGGGVGLGPRFVNLFIDIVPPGAPAEYGLGGSAPQPDIPIRGVVEAWFSECLYPKFALIDGEGPKATGLTRFAYTDQFLLDPVFRQPPFADPNTPLSVQFIGGLLEPGATTCATAPDQIYDRWLGNAELMNRWVGRYAAQLLGTKENDINGIYRVYDMVDTYFPDENLGTFDRLAQLATMNMAYAAYLKMTAEYGMTGAADLIRRKQATAWIEMARLGARILPVMREISEAVIYLFGAFLPIFIAVAGISALFMYVKAVFWLGLWIPVFAIFSAIGHHHMLKGIDSAMDCGTGTCMLMLNFATIDKLKDTAGIIMGYLGILSMSSPFIAWGLLRGAESLGGFLGSMVSTGEAGRTGAATATERLGALTGYTAGTMVGSAAAASQGVRTSMAGIQAYDKWGGAALTGAAYASLGQAVGKWANLAEAGQLDLNAFGLGFTEGARGLAQWGYMQELQRAGEIAIGRPVSLKEAFGLLYGMNALRIGEGTWIMDAGGGKLIVDTNKGKAELYDWSQTPFSAHVREAQTYRSASSYLMSDTVTKQAATGVVKRIVEGTESGVSRETRETLLNQLREEIARAMEEWERSQREKGRGKEWGIKGEFGVKTPSQWILDAGGEVFASYHRLEQALRQSGVGTEIKDVMLKSYAKAVEKVTGEFMKSRTGFETVKELARKESAEVGRKFDEAYTKADEVARSTEYKVTTATLSNYMMDKYGQLSPLERVARTHQDLAEAQRKGTREAYEPFLKYMPVEQPSHIEKETAAKIEEGKRTVKTEGSKLEEPTKKIKEPSRRGRSRKTEKSPQLKEPDTDEFNRKFEKRGEEIEKKYKE
jgi:hypothetical protein